MFITLEGPEGSGKTSQIAPFADYMRAQGYKVVTTREPGGTSIGDQIRHVLVSMENQNLHPRTEILLFLAARAQLVEELIKPALDDGKIVICDRYGDSTLAYQGYGHGLPLGLLREMLRFATDGLVPDLTLYLDIEVEKGLSRKKKEQEWNRLDAYEVEFHQRVRNGYLTLAAEEPKRWRVIDASASKLKVQQAMQKAVMTAINMKN